MLILAGAIHGFQPHILLWYAQASHIICRYLKRDPGETNGLLFFDQHILIFLRTKK